MYVCILRTNLYMYASVLCVYVWSVGHFTVLYIAFAWLCFADGCSLVYMRVYACMYVWYPYANSLSPSPTLCMYVCVFLLFIYE